LLYAAYLAFITQASFLYTETYQLPLLQYIFHQGCVILAFAIMSLMSGRALHVLGGRTSIITGITISTMGALGMIMIGLFNPSSPYPVTLFMSLEGMGSAIAYPVIFAASLDLFPEIKGAASSLVMSMRALICFVIVGISSFIYNGHPVRIALIVLLTIVICVLLTARLLRTHIFTTLLSHPNAS
jgi:DHA1 family bicyclomycin/chloramphenicol resistance-like MFS transporter